MNADLLLVLGVTARADGLDDAVGKRLDAVAAAFAPIVRFLHRD
jgi:hypothetical protein